MGFKVPEEISICGFTNGDRAKASDPMLTTVEQRGVASGERLQYPDWSGGRIHPLKMRWRKSGENTTRGERNNEIKI